MQKIKNAIRDRSYPNRGEAIDVAIEFSGLIYEYHGTNNYYLQKHCEFLLLRRGREEEVIIKIVDFFINTVDSFC